MCVTSDLACVPFPFPFPVPYRSIVSMPRSNLKLSRMSRTLSWKAPTQESAMIASLWKVGFSLPPSPSKDAIYMYSCSLCRVFLSEQAVHPAREAGDNLEDPPKVWLLQHSHSQGQLPPAGVCHSLLLSINIPTCNYQGPPHNLYIIWQLVSFI